MQIQDTKATHIFSAKILAYMPFNDQSFNDSLTNDIVSFEQLGPGSFNDRFYLSFFVAMHGFRESDFDYY